MNHRIFNAIVAGATLVVLVGGISWTVVDALRNPEAMAAAYDRNISERADPKVAELEHQVKTLSAEVERLKKSQAPER